MVKQITGKIALNYLEKNQGTFTRASDQIWNFAEVGLQEYQSAKVIQKLLEDAGFQLEVGVAGMPTAFVATWGKGKPTIGFLGEYDALPGCSQKVVPFKDPVKEGAPGHGCGHNLLGVGSAAAAIATKEEIVSRGLKGTLKYFGCPAEELVVGKVFMSAHDYFKSLDCAFTWHPGQTNNVRVTDNNALNSAKFRFHGQSAHAASNPHSGKSALDACILMDVATNYLREHIIQDARIHSVITHGGEQPNVVPAFAEIWYYVRAPKRRYVEEIYTQVVKNAEAAAIMTSTTLDIEFLTGTHEFIRNIKLARVMQENLNKIGPTKFTKEEHEFAEELSGSINTEMKEKILLSKKIPLDLMGKNIHESILDIYGLGDITFGSDDTGDVSYQTPLVQLLTACQVLGMPGHSWQVTANSGMSIGHKGMMLASKVIALTALDLIESPKLLEEVYNEWVKSTKDNPYKCSVPKGAQPNLNQIIE